MSALSAVSVLALGLTGLAGCAPTRPSSTDGILRVMTSFYPLQFVAERVGGVHVQVSNLTAAGAEPHDVELSARDLVAMREADVVLYLAGLAPAVDDGVRIAARGHALDVSEAAGLVDEADGHVDEADGHVDEADGHVDEADGHVDEADGHADETDGHDHDADTHFWLDPTRLADVARAVSLRLSAADPTHAADYTANADALIRTLTTLDQDLAAGLATCEARDLVTSHAAFGFLARRYGLEEWGIVGLAPDAEPTATALARIADLVRERGVRTVYTETLVSDAVARTVAEATGAAVAVLDPLEGLTDGATGDYLTIMRTNLATLRRGLGCT